MLTGSNPRTGCVFSSISYSWRGLHDELTVPEQSDISWLQSPTQCWCGIGISGLTWLRTARLSSLRKVTFDFEHVLK